MAIIISLVEETLIPNFLGVPFSTNNKSNKIKRAIGLAARGVFTKSYEDVYVRVMYCDDGREKPKRSEQL